MVSARLLAYQVLLHIEQKASHPDRLIRSTLDRHSGLDERDRALLTELVYGVVRWRDRLDWHIAQLSKTKPGKIAPPVRILLRLALYQIFFLDRVPAHAAVNESVKIAGSIQPPHVVRFVNAVLREAARREGNWTWPDPAENPAGHLAVTTSHPLWFVRRCIEEFGFEEARALCLANNAVAPAALRVNALKSTRAQVIAGLAEAHVEAVASPYLQHAVRVSGARQDLTRTRIYQEGWFQMQDEASQIVTHILAPEPGERVLDLCAGFGIKSTHIAIFMENEGKVLAVDNSAWKLEELRKNAERQGAVIIDTLAEDVLGLQPEKIGLFDRVLLDAPCSGFGSVRRNPDIKWTRHPKDPYRLSQLQKQLLEWASRFVKEGGVLVYATCTIFREENEGVADQFSEAHPEWKIEPASDHLPEPCRGMSSGPCFRSFPHRHGIDGFFAARWRRPLQGARF